MTGKSIKVKAHVRMGKRVKAHMRKVDSAKKAPKEYDGEEDEYADDDEEVVSMYRSRSHLRKPKNKELNERITKGAGTFNRKRRPSKSGGKKHSMRPQEYTPTPGGKHSYARKRPDRSVEKSIERNQAKRAGKKRTGDRPSKYTASPTGKSSRSGGSKSYGKKGYGSKGYGGMRSSYSPSVYTGKGSKGKKGIKGKSKKY